MFFPVFVSTLGLGLEAKMLKKQNGLSVGLGLEKLLRTRFWSRKVWSGLQRWFVYYASSFFKYNPSLISVADLE